MAKFSSQYTINKFIILISLFSIKAITSYSYHYHDNENKILNRNKRDVFPPNTLKIRITHGNYTEIFELSKWESNYLVNWNATVYEYQNTLNLFYNVGQMSRFKDLTTFYYSESTHSALILYHSTNSGGNYSVNGIVGEKYVLEYKPYVESEGIATINLEPTDVIPKKTKRQTRSIAEASKIAIGNSYKNPEFYVETLVFIDGKSINKEFAGEIERESNQQKLYIMQVLSFFNVMNMLFSTTNFKINIAGIIFTRTHEDEGFSFLNSALKDTHRYNIPQVTTAFYEVLSNLPDNLKYRDSFDCIFYLTDFFLWDTETNNGIEGFLSYPTQGIYQMRKLGYSHSYPLIISSSSLNYPSVANAAHHFFHLIGSANYIQKYNTSDRSQSTIIRDFDSKCANCYDWTKDYCVFINKPRVNGPNPSILVSKDDQCWCYDYSYKYHNNTKITSNDICTEGFQCEHDTKVVLNVTLVLDGTPCGNNKVCWNKVCTEIL